jgi:V/A-type H+-transporting ATPase subunit E
MTDLEKADSRIQVICEKIRNETLDPAKEEASIIIAQAKRDAEQIIGQARREAERLQKELKKSLEEEKLIFQSSLQQASKQSLEQLKLKIEQTLFNPQLDKWIQEQLGNEADHAKLINVIVDAIQKEGTHAELSILVPQKFSAEKITAHLSQEVLKRLKDQTVQLANLPAGIQVRLVGKNIVLDLSAESLEEIMASFVRKDFRKVFFST